MAFIPVKSESDLEAALSAETAILFKHSTRCGVSAAAYEQMESFTSANPQTPVYMVDVNTERALSDAAAERLGVRHQSPQVILLQSGQPAWDTSHFRVTREEIENRLAG